MKRGLWMFNGESIVISPAGRILDGAHRLSACLAADVSFDTLIVEGVDETTFATFDGGSKRNAYDALSIAGVKNAAHCVSAIRTFYGYSTGSWAAAKNLSGQELLRFYHALLSTDAFDDSVSKALPLRGIGPVGAGGAAHYIFSQIDPTAADVFIEDLARGSGLAGNDPVWALREELTSQRRQNLQAQSRELLILFIKAWNRRRAGTPTTRLRMFKKSSPDAEVHVPSPV